MGKKDFSKGRANVVVPAIDITDFFAGCNKDAIVTEKEGGLWPNDPNENIHLESLYTLGFGPPTIEINAVTGAKSVGPQLLYLNGSNGKGRNIGLNTKDNVRIYTGPQNSACQSFVQGMIRASDNKLDIHGVDDTYFGVNIATYEWPKGGRFPTTAEELENVTLEKKGMTLVRFRFSINGNSVDDDVRTAFKNAYDPNSPVTIADAMTFYKNSLPDINDNSLYHEYKTSPHASLPLFDSRLVVIERAEAKKGVFFMLNVFGSYPGWNGLIQYMAKAYSPSPGFSLGDVARTQGSVKNSDVLMKAFAKNKPGKKKAS